MKTPREILLARHRAAEPKLDHIRHAAVEVAADVNRRNVTVREFAFAATVVRTLATLHRELIWPCRRTWAGLAAVWLVLLSVNFATREPAPVREARRETPPSPQLREILRQQEQLLAELVGPIGKPEAIRPKPVAPQPRSQGCEEVMNA